MTNSDGNRLFEAVREALARRMAEPDPAVRRRVLEGFANTKSSGTWVAHRFVFAGLAVAAALAVVAALRFRHPASTTFQVAGQSGRIGSVLEPSASQALPLLFSEGTRVSLGAGSRGRVTGLTPHGARVELERGTVTAEVVHRPGAEWTFGAGPFEVTVLGTQLNVSWDPAAGLFALGVSRGVVRVRGPVIEGAQEVRAGQMCRVDLGRKLIELGSATAALTHEAPPPARASSATPSAAAPSSSENVASPPAPSEPVKPAWVTLAQVGKHRDAVAAAERAGLPGVYRSASAESLLELARAARLAGHPEIERAALLACRKRAPGQATAAQAAYLLGRASAPAEAIGWFEAYLRDQPQGLLAREASGRLIESYVAAGQHAGAAQAASRYLAAHPHGPHASMARQVLSSSERRE